MNSQVLIQTFSPCEINMRNCTPDPANRLRNQHLEQTEHFHLQFQGSDHDKIT